MKKDDKLWEPDDFSPLFIEDIKSILQKLYNQFRAVKLRNEALEEENERLKSQAYKDEELIKMKEKYESMKSDYHRGFPISKEDEIKIHDWIKKAPKIEEGAIGGRFIYQFLPTSIGVIGTVIDSFTGEKFNYQELD